MTDPDTRRTQPTDRLSEIEERFDSDYYVLFQVGQIDMKWLLEEIKRLRAERIAFLGQGAYSHFQELEAEVKQLRAALIEITELELEGDASLDDAIFLATEVLNEVAGNSAQHPEQQHDERQR